MFPQRILHEQPPNKIPMPIGEGHDAILSMLSVLHKEKQLKIGLNSVFKSLQKNKIRYVIITYDVNPPELIDHVLALSSSQSIPIIPIKITKQKLGETLGLRSACVVGLLNTISNEVDQLLLPFSTLV